MMRFKPHQEAEKRKEDAAKSLAEQQLAQAQAECSDFSLG